MAWRFLVALAFLTALATAQDHAYAPDAAWLVHATDKWLVWRPDDLGASLDPPAASGETAGPGGNLEIKKPKLPDLRPRTVYVLQSVADAKELRKIVVEWKDAFTKPIGVRPVTVLDEGTIVLSGMKRDDLFLCRESGEPRRHVLFARSQPAVLVAAYPDGVVLQTPPPDDVKPRGLEPRMKTAVLYWADWDEYGVDSDKARAMSFHEGVITGFDLRVARLGDDIAMPGGVYSPRTKRRQRFRTKLAESIYAFDGRVALGRAFSFSVRESDGIGMVDHEYLVARDGIGYWVEKDKGASWTIRACRLRDPGRTLPLGTVRYAGSLSPQRCIEGSTVALEDIDSKARFTIYWDKDGIRWTGEAGWQSRAWLHEAEFK